jgi:hypothetical protein
MVEIQNDKIFAFFLNVLIILHYILTQPRIFEETMIDCSRFKNEKIANTNFIQLLIWDDLRMEFIYKAKILPQLFRKGIV